MKQHIKTEDLKKNTRFSEDVFFECGVCLLLSAGNPLSDRELRALRQWKIPFVVTEGEIINDDEELDVEALESPEEVPESGKTSNIYIEGTQLSDANIEIVSKMVVFDLPKELKDSSLYLEYQNIVKELTEVFNAIKENQGLSEKALSPYALKIQKMASEYSQETIMFVLAGNVQDHDVALEALNTSLMIALICSLMSIDEKVALDVIVAGLLHNVGMLRLSTPLINKTDKLTEAEIQILTTLNSLAYKCAVEELLYPESIGNSVLQQYERWDGKGYPNGLSGANIDLGARLISVVDGFITALGKKAQRRPILSYEAIKTLLSDSSLKFDPNIVKVVVQCMGIYPIGSIVLLNDGAICKVVQIASDAPLRPCVQVILSETGKIPSEEQKLIIDLKENKEKFIVRAVDPRVYLQ
ncbi:MAG: HD-GYP domain-containing protein [Treponema sp.]